MINLVVIVFLFVFGLALPQVRAQGVNCDDNAVVFCGASSTGSLISKYDNGDGHNTAASIQHIYSSFSISSSDIHAMGSTSEMGSVTSSNQVFLDGKLVANNVLTAGRDCSIGGTPRDVQGTKFCARPPSVSFASSPLSAFVVMRGGVFQFAILTSCGNPVTGHPTTTPPPAPTPKPMPTTPTTPTPTPAQPTPPAPTTTPAAQPQPTPVNNSVCTGNTANSSTGTASQGGNCSTNTTVVQTQQQTPPSQPAAPTSSNSSQTQNQSESTSATANAAPISTSANTMASQSQETSATPATTETPTPTTTPPATTSSVTTAAAPASTPTSLINTGPGTLGAIGGLFTGTTILGTVAYSWLLRRRLQHS